MAEVFHWFGNNFLFYITENQIMKTWQIMILFLLIVPIDSMSSALKVNSLNVHQDSITYDLQSPCLILEIYTDSLKMAGILSDSDHHWAPLGKTTSNDIYWGKMSLNNTDSININYLLEFGLNSYMDLYVVNNGLIISHQQSGELVLSGVKTPHYKLEGSLFRLSIPAQQAASIYFKVRNTLQQLPNIDPKITLATKWHQVPSTKWPLQWMYQGFLWAFIICSLAVFFLEKDKIYLYFIVFISSLSVYLVWYSGVLYTLMPSDFSLFNSYFILVGALIPICHLLFTESVISYSDSGINLKKITQIAIKASSVIAAMTMLIYIFTSDRQLIMLIYYNVLIALSIFGFYLLIKLYFTEHIINKLLAFGSFIFMTLGISALIAEYNFNHPGAIYFIELGSVLEFVICSFAIGYRIKAMNWKRKKTHAMAILHYEKNQILQKNINNQLGQTITRKELELKQKNLELKNTIKELTTSRLSNNRQHYTYTDVNALVIDTIELLDPPSDVNVKISSKLPIIAADSVHLQQVFQNLIDNSIKFMDPQKGEVEISHLECESFWEFSVKDNGPGIESKHLETILEIFHTLNPKEVDAKNTMIGLAIVRKIVELHGGEVTVISAPYICTEFRFTVSKRLGDTSHLEEEQFKMMTDQK
jgi:signal transduction histidine kinase